MALWLFQALLNLVFIVVAVQWILSRKRIERLENTLGALLRKQARPELSGSQVPIANVGAPAAPSDAQSQASASMMPAVQEPSVRREQADGSLFERQVSGNTVNKREGGAQAYERASEMLVRGRSHGEVARVTGLSQAELALITKMSRQTQ